MGGKTFFAIKIMEVQMYLRKNFGFLILLILIVLLPHLAQSTTPPEQIAEKFVELLATKNYDGAYQMMDS
ncbi:hypothetical protein DRQ27_01600, partial [bacterium]